MQTSHLTPPLSRQTLPPPSQAQLPAVSSLATQSASPTQPPRWGRPPGRSCPTGSRFKAQERNVTLSTGFLEELSLIYIKQIGPFQFSWRHIYSGTDYSVSDVSHELAAVMYNIKALHSRLGVGEDRQDSDGMKMCAAWAFHTLPDQFPQVMAFKSQLCLAQAQECILEKSLLDCRRPGIVTKVCGQVVEYYKQALKQLEMSLSKKLKQCAKP
jgi:hypothetical protein